MRAIVVSAILLLPATSALAGDNTAVGVGISNSTAISSSKSQATAIGGGNAVAKGGTGIGIGTGGNVTIQQTPAVTTQNVVTSGTSTVRNVPSVFAPGLAAAGLETCLGSVSGGGSFVGTGLTFGTSIPDPGCAARLDARTLWSMGLKKAAVARLCLNPDINRSMPEVCGSYLPQPVVYPAGYGAPLPPPLPYPGAFAAVDSTGAVMLVEGKTGREHLCSMYDAAAQLCRKWADGTPVAGATKKHLVAHHTPKAVPARLKVDPPPAAAPKAAEVIVP